MTGLHSASSPTHTEPPHGASTSSVNLVGIAVRPSSHYTRLWPTRPGERSDAPLFLAAMLPFRLAALALLWLTSSPGRFALSLLTVAVLWLTAVIA